MSARDEAIEAAKQAFLEFISSIQEPEGVDDDDDLSWQYLHAGLVKGIAAFEAAMLERGWKMTPRKATKAMKDMYIDDWHMRGESWSDQWDAAPSPGDEP